VPLRPAKSGIFALSAAWPAALVASPVASPTALVALSAALLTTATGVGLRDFREFVGELFDLLDPLRERTRDFSEPPERFFAAGFALV
jgi:hypothetical protein